MDIIAYIVIAVWLLGSIVFFGFIRYEATKQEAEFNSLQVIVALFWWAWVPWYGYTVSKDWWINK